ncbi:MAG: TlpA family protein disulfide reductase [Prevotella sp.]
MSYKRILSLLSAILFAGTWVSAQEKLSVIDCHWTEPTEREMTLYKFEDCQLVKVASATVGPDGYFSFAFRPSYKGFYVIGRNEKSAMNRYVAYMKPGDALQMEIVDDTYHLTGKNTEENIELEKWHDFVQPLEGKSVYFMRKRSTFRDFFPELEAMLPKVEAYPAAKTKNKEFNRAFESFKKFHFAEIAVQFISTPRTEHPKSVEFIDLYRNLSIHKLSGNTDILNYPEGVGLLEKIYYCALRANPKYEGDAFREAYKNAHFTLLDGDYFGNDTVRAEYLLNKAAMCKSYKDIMVLKEKYEKLLVTEDQRVRFRMLLGKLDTNEAGHEAIDFRFQDTNGKQVALSDFRGKVIYIDVWATWCGPCKQQIPFMTKLEEEYAHRKDIVFLSVSTDQSKDIDKWKAMVKEKGMKGVQLCTGDRMQEILQPYKIKGIPRFILIGKDFTIVNPDAPRPSSGEEIRKLLDEAVNVKVKR